MARLAPGNDERKSLLDEQVSPGSASGGRSGFARFCVGFREGLLVAAVMAAVRAVQVDRLTSGLPRVEKHWCFTSFESATLSSRWFQMTTCTPTPRPRPSRSPSSAGSRICSAGPYQQPPRKKRG